MGIGNRWYRQKVYKEMKKYTLANNTGAYSANIQLKII